MRQVSFITEKYLRAGIVFLFAFLILSSACTSTATVRKVAELQKSGKTAEALSMVTILAVGGDAAAQAWLGAMYSDGKLVKKNYEKSFRWQLKASKQGHIIAQYNVAVFYARGKGVVKNNQRAVYWFRQAADAGMPQAQLHMGLMREKGWGLSHCPFAASRWYYLAGQTFIENENLVMAQHAQENIQRILPGYYLAQQLKDEIFLSGGNN